VAVAEVKQRRRTWLNVIGWVLAGILVFDVGSIPLVVFGHGAPAVGTVSISDIFSGEPYVSANVPQRLPGLSLGQVTVSADRPSRAEDVLYCLGNGLAVALVLIPLLIAAIRLTEHARLNDPFAPQMVRRLRRLGLWTLALGLLSTVVEYAAQNILLNMALPPDPTLRTWATISHHPTPWWWLLSGLMLLGFSEIVRHGCDLRAELDEVI
jgi:hypothetical protein